MKSKINFNDNEMVGNITNIYATLYAKFKPIFDEMNIAYNMTVSKNQWDSASKAELTEQGRPANAYNLISNVVKHFSSVEGGTRKQIAAAPRTPGDIQYSATMTKLLTTLNDAVNYNYYRSRAFIDAIIAKWGWIRTAWSFEDDPLGMLALDAINPMEIMFDMGYSDITLKKCNYVLYTPDMTLDQIIHQYATNDKDLLNAILEKGNTYFTQNQHDQKKFISTAIRTLISVASSYFTGGYSDEYNQTLRKTDWFDQLTGKFKILELHERRTSRRMMLFDPDTNKNIDITDDVMGEDGYNEDEELVKQVMSKYPNAVEPTWGLQKQIWITTVIPALNLKVYDAPYAVQNGNFMFTPVFCYDFHADMSQTQSVVDELIDPQSDYNKRRSTMLEMLVRFSAVGYVVEEGVIDGFESDWESKKIGMYKRIKKGSMGKIQPETYPHIPPELFRDAEESKLLIEYISNTPKTVRGQGESSTETGVLFNSKKDSALQMVQHLYDNLDEANKAVGQNEVSNIQKFMKMERAFRIATDFDKPEFLEVNKPEVAIQEGKVIQRILNDVTIGKFDIVISEAPYGATAREVEFLKLVDLMKFAIEVNPQQAQQMLPIVIKASDSPYKSEIMEALGMMGEQKEQAQQTATAMQALEQAFQKLGLDKARLEVQNQMLQNEQDKVETEGKALDNEKKKAELTADVQAQRVKDALNKYVQNNQYASA